MWLRRVPLTPEEHARGTFLAKQYTRRLQGRNNRVEKDITNKIILKWRAIGSLPTDELRREVRWPLPAPPLLACGIAMRTAPLLQALRIEDACVPLGKPLATWTPPLKGFHWDDSDSDGEAAVPVAASNDVKQRKRQ